LRDIQGERGTYAPNYGVLFSNAAGTCTGFGLLDCYWQVGTYSIAAAGSTPVVDSMHVYGLQEFGASKGINIPGTLSGSVVVFPGIINVGTFTGLIQGNSSNITITNQNGVIIDQGSGNLLASGGLGLYKNPAAGQLTGWGTPTSGSVVNNFPGSGASTAQCGSALTAIIITLKAFGLFGA